MFWRKRREQSPAERLRSGRWTCGSCDTTHGWPFDLAARAPDPWTGSKDYAPNSALCMDGDFLSEDFCILNGEHFLVRAVLTIPVVGLDDDFGFGCWTTLSRKNFDHFVTEFDDGHDGEGELWSGWLCNQLVGFVEEDPVAVWVQRRPDRLRPLLWVQDDAHPLARAQNDGISAEQMIDILTHYGHAPA